MKKENVSEFSKGLHQDNSPQKQPKGTYRFALNSVNETELGDFTENSIEESNEICAALPVDFIPIGKVYIGNEKTALFLVKKDDSVSEIGIIDNFCNYTTIVNDSTSTSIRKLGFKVQNQIDAVYRLRKGCERNIYWVDGKNNVPRQFNFDKLNSYKTGSQWDAAKFQLIRTFSKVPKIEEIEVLDSGGQIEPGSINVVIQYLDDNLNPTEWIISSDIIKIYNEELTQGYRGISGSINSSEDYINFPITDKAIKVVYNNLDETFPFYRLAFVIANTGTGEVSQIKITDKISIKNNEFIFTGANFVTLGSLEDIIAVSNPITSAGSIEQIENRLILGNVQGNQVNFCNLQRFASKINVDLCVKKVPFLNQVKPEDPKHPTYNFENVGYMPGEIYSLGVVYKFEDGTLSPAYHIPGKHQNTSSKTSFTFGDNIYGMSNNNLSQSNYYLDNTDCGNKSLWGVDSLGKPLKDQPVRHHRFPLRSELGQSSMVNTTIQNNTSNAFQFLLKGVGEIQTMCTAEDVANNLCPSEQNAPSFQVSIVFDIGGGQTSYIKTIDPNLYTNSTNVYQLSFEDILPGVSNTANINIISIEETDNNGVLQPVTIGTPSPKGITYTTESRSYNQGIEEASYEFEIFGLKISNIEFPDASETNGVKIVGYYIVRHERTELEKTILDSGVLLPMINNNGYVSHGLLNPEIEDSKISRKNFALLHPEHKFNNKKYIEYSEILDEGYYTYGNASKSYCRYRDVLDGTSYDPEVHREEYEDDDGWSLKIITRDSLMNYKTPNNSTVKFNVAGSNIKETAYYNALESKLRKDSNTILYNNSADNKIGIVQLKTNHSFSIKDRVPYVYLKRDVANPYSNFRITEYIKASKNYETGDTATIFGGDTHITSLNYVNTIFWENRVAKRAVKKGVWQIVAGVLLAVAAAAILIFTFAAGIAVSSLLLGAGIAIIGGGVLLTASGINKENVVKAYNEDYEKGLKNTVLDDFVTDEFLYHKYGTNGTDDKNRTFSPEDDEIQWVGDSLVNVWFESQVNMSLRHGMVSDAPTFLPSPGAVETGYTTLEITGIANTLTSSDQDVPFIRDYYTPPYRALDIHIMNKLSVFDPSRKDKRLYIGHPLGEYYAINPDYTRINREKRFFHLPDEYDCCSDCQEDFPHRVVYSEQSFQEELSDNFKTFLPNNYKDIEGETGVITDLFRIKDNLYIHTQEALWHLPQQFQERITNDIISFIGTGNFFSVPPKKILDEKKYSGGTEHKWATVKTKYGISFVSEKEGKIYLFDGNSLKAISDIGLFNWFKENTRLQLNDNYLKQTGEKYPYDNNPSNLYGTGFISVYDTKKERLIFTKKDFFDTNKIFSDSHTIIINGVLRIFLNYKQTINTRIANGWVYLGIIDGVMVFEKFVSTTVQGVVYEPRPGTTPISVPYTYEKFTSVRETVKPTVQRSNGILNNSWTISFSLKTNSWTSWHSYLPNFYHFTNNIFTSWIYGNKNLWRHGKVGSYRTFYNSPSPYIIEYVSVSEPLNTKIFNDITLHTEAKKYNEEMETYVDVKDVTFNKAIMYNTNQCTGELTLEVKNKKIPEGNYMVQQVVDVAANTIVIDRNERNWSINDIRDIRIDYNQPIFRKNIENLQTEYYIDKVLNTTSLDENKDWTQLQSMRDKYLVVRLIFDNFTDVKLLMNFSIETETESHR